MQVMRLVRVSIHIASQNQFGVELTSEQIQPAIEMARDKFAQHFGGFTEMRGLGGWMNARLGIVQLQNVVVIESMSSEDVDWQWLWPLAEEVRVMLGQNCVLLTNGEDMALVDGR